MMRSVLSAGRVLLFGMLALVSFLLSLDLAAYLSGALTVEPITPLASVAVVMTTLVMFGASLVLAHAAATSVQATGPLLAYQYNGRKAFGKPFSDREVPVRGHYGARGPHDSHGLHDSYGPREPRPMSPPQGNAGGTLDHETDTYDQREPGSARLRK